MIATLWIAALSWRFPFRDRRWFFGLPDQAGCGAVPCRAKESLFLKRRMSATSPRILACRERPDADQLEEVGSQGGDAPADFLCKVTLGLGQRSDPSDKVSRDSGDQSSELS